MLPTSLHTDVHSNYSLHNKRGFDFSVLPKHGQYCTYRYFGISLHDVVSLTIQMHNIFLEFSSVFGRGGGGCVVLHAWIGVKKIIKKRNLKMLTTSTLQNGTCLVKVNITLQKRKFETFFNMKFSLADFSRPRTVTVRLTSCSYLYLCFCCRGSGDGERKTHQS